jgi:hypothetical protein
MKRLFVLLCFSGAWLSGAELASIHSVYLLSMSRGLDQYLANQLTAGHVFDVVTDPKLADAIITDRIGEAFEEKLAGLLPVKELPAKEPAKAGAAPAAPGKDAAARPAEAQAAAVGLLPTETANKLTDPMISSTFGRARGMVFLVDPISRHVLWSTYQPPKNSSTAQLEHTASDIVNRLKHDLKSDLKKQ